MASMESSRDREQANRYLHERGLLSELKNMPDDVDVRHLLRYIHTAGLCVQDQPKELRRDDGSVQTGNMPPHEPDDLPTEETVLDQTRHPEVSLATLADHLHDLSGANTPELLRAMVASAVDSIVNGEENLRKIDLPFLLGRFTENNPDGISVQLGHMSSEPIEGKVGHLLRIVSNLVANAKRVMETRNKIPGTITISTEQNAGKTQIIIEDEGGGIPEEMLEGLFENEKVGIEGGTGRGLKGAKKLLEDWGQIKAENIMNAERETSGARFIIELKEGNELDFSFLSEVEVAPTLTELKELPEKPTLKPYILVVEDNSVNKMVIVGMIKRILGENGLEDEVDIVTATNADETLTEMKRMVIEKKTLPMHIFMDRHIPGSQDGLEMAQAMKRHASLRITMVTAATFPNDLMAYGQAGMTVMPKPFQKETMEEILQREPGRPKKNMMPSEVRNETFWERVMFEAQKYFRFLR